MTNHNKTEIPSEVLDQIYTQANRENDTEFIFNYKDRWYKIVWRKLQWSQPIRVNRLKLNK